MKVEGQSDRAESDRGVRVDAMFLESRSLSARTMPVTAKPRLVATERSVTPAHAHQRLTACHPNSAAPSPPVAGSSPASRGTSHLYPGTGHQIRQRTLSRKVSTALSGSLRYRSFNGR